ncbi:MAG: microcin ABC transporter ATP-binding protein, partial [Alphaproteobacteria bacterium]
VQAQIVDLLRDLQIRYKISYLFISHDLKVVRALADQLIVMRNGKVVEQGKSSEIFKKPSTNYTRELLSAALNLETPENTHIN